MNNPDIHVQDAPYYNLLGTHVRIVLSSKQTGGQFSMIEGSVPVHGDGGLHMHAREDESMLLIEGELEVTVGQRVFTLKAGQSYFLPRGVPQRLRNLGSIPARSVVVTTPGGFDEFIAEAAKPCGPVAPPLIKPTPEDIARLLNVAVKHGITLLQQPELDPS